MYYIIYIIVYNYNNQKYGIKIHLTEKHTLQGLCATRVFCHFFPH